LALPGPIFNCSLFFGAVIDGLKGGLIGFLMLFTPAFLTIWGVLPYWRNYRGNKNI
jgi:chromate transporter